MTVFVIVLLIIVGFLLLMIEFFVIPGITIAGIGALILIGGGIICGYYFHPVSTGNYIFLGSGLSMIVLFIVALKGKTWRRFGLKTEIEGKVGVLEEGSIKVGDTGETVSKLSPIGKAMINDGLYEVRSEGSYLDAHKEIKVIRIDGNKVYVKLK
jgi:membrane-bound ClpP family serine protease